MKRQMALVGILLALSAPLQAETTEPGWKASLRQGLGRILGNERAAKLLGPKPVAEADMALPQLPELQKQNTDTSVYKRDTELGRQGAEFAALPADKRRSFDVAFLRELFEATRRAPAKSDDLAKWINVLENGGTREGVYRGLVLDEVYSSLEGYEDPLSPGLVKWTVGFARRFLGLAFQEDAFKQANLFFLKRHIAEKMLEMMDALEARPDDFRRWYGVFSAYLAQEFPELWNGPIRGQVDPAVHVAWARRAPLQHIKSEALVKLHLVMNRLQDAQ